MTLDYDAARRKMKDVGLQSGAWNNVLVAAEALDRGIEISTTGRGVRIRMKHGTSSHYWRLGKTSLNSPLAVKCADLKEVTSRLLRSANVNAPENAIFDPHDAKRAWAWAEAIAPVVIKPNNSMQGIGIFMDLDNWDDFSRAFEEASTSDGEILVERFQPGQDHRVLVVDNQVIAAMRRIAANVRGDGKSTVSELIFKKNQNRPVNHKQLLVDNNVIRYLNRRGRTLDSVPNEGEQVQLRGTANLHTGGDTVDATDLLTSTQIHHVEAGARAIPGLRVAGFDLLIPETPDTGEPSILEVNSNPFISMHHFPGSGQARDAAGAVVNAMFPDTEPPLDLPKNAGAASR